MIILIVECARFVTRRLLYDNAIDEAFACIESAFHLILSHSLSQRAGQRKNEQRHTTGNKLPLCLQRAESHAPI